MLQAVVNLLIFVDVFFVPPAFRGAPLHGVATIVQAFTHEPTHPLDIHPLYPTGKILEAIDRLNGIDPFLVEGVECPGLHPYYVDSGEMGGLVHCRQMQLARKGYTARWDKAARVYWLRKREE